MRLLPLLLLLALAASAAAAAKPWTPGAFPDPTADWDACGAKVKTHVCDPGADHLLLTFL